MNRINAALKRITSFEVALAACAALLAACSGSPPAPVSERAPVPYVAQAPVAVPKPVPPPPPAPPPGSYIVRRGDTLYSIALDNGLDYREVAAWNGIADPNVIREGQVLALKAPASDVQVRPIAGPGGVAVRPLGDETARVTPPPAPSPSADLVTEPKALKLPYSEQNVALLTRPSPSKIAPAAKPAPATGPAIVPPPPPVGAQASAPPDAERAKTEGDVPSLDWGWPANGKIIGRFSDPANKGVDIAGQAGEPVFAAASGVVIYTGTGIPSLGKLVIIKHNGNLLSAYAHNENVAVKLDQTVTKGQKIAEIGASGTDQPKLHFEIRQLGKPVDPLKFLPDRPS